MEKGLRPLDTAVFANVAAALMPKIAHWVGAQWLDNAGIDEMVQELTSLFEEEREDAYRMARVLDDRGWEADEKLVEILRGVPALIEKYRAMPNGAH